MAFNYKSKRESVGHDIQGFGVCQWLLYHVKHATETEEGWLYGVSVTLNSQGLHLPPLHVFQYVRCRHYCDYGCADDRI